MLDLAPQEVLGELAVGRGRPACLGERGRNGGREPVAPVAVYLDRAERWASRRVGWCGLAGPESTSSTAADPLWLVPVGAAHGRGGPSAMWPSRPCGGWPAWAEFCPVLSRPPARRCSAPLI
eukprot:scaffold13197_cov95-Isochrysis_galbana.AAC.2